MTVAAMFKRIISILLTLALIAALTALPAPTHSHSGSASASDFGPPAPEPGDEGDTGDGTDPIDPAGPAGSPEPDESAGPEDELPEGTDPDDETGLPLETQGLPPDTDPQDLPYAPGRVIVKLASNPRLRSLPDFGIEIAGMRLINPSAGTGGFQMFQTMSTDASQDNLYVLILENAGAGAVENALEILGSNPAVEYAEPDYKRGPFAVPDDPRYGSQYALAKLNAPAAWDITTGSRDVVVGIIDTGIRGTHEDLIDNLWINPDPGTGGYADDVNGYDFGGRTGGTPTDWHGHGTHVAGITGAKGNNGKGIAGINWEVSLAWLGILDEQGYMYDSYAIEAINYAKNKNIPILNASWGGDYYSVSLESAIAAYPGLFVAAAGNDSRDNTEYPSYPANYDLPNLISVASTDLSDDLSDFSNYGTNVHIAAPGSDILSTYKNSDISYAGMGGTSMAAPYIAGIAALILSVYPGSTVAELKAAILDTARPVSAFDAYGGFGIADAAAAIDEFRVEFDGLPGDVNGDGLVNGTDVQAMILWINAGRPEGRINEAAGRVTSSYGRPDASDIQALVVWINKGGKAAEGMPPP